MVQKIDRKERGVGMQNFQYAPAWDEFVHIVKIHSPRAHRFLSQHFPARTERKIRLKESKEPKIPFTICDETFALVKTHLDKLEYLGPVAVSCDDTKLFSTLRLHWDQKKGTYFLLGGVGPPIAVPDPESVSKYMNDPNIVKGTKARTGGWYKYPSPRFLPVVVAALPITDNFPVPKLLDLHTKIIYGLLSKDIIIISYSCEGYRD
ncbi:hypothetical protein MPER_02529 [Moniliophthora perniciosa FA553]|nr:hypothetical protein MPER_02529 [Moniliophthora perniciosa FA553]